MGMKRAYRLYGLLLFGTVLLAAVCGPYSCEWGNAVYFFAGLTGLLLSFLAALFQKDWPGKKRWLTGFLFAAGLIVVWVGGFMLGAFQILCRLF